MPHALLFLHHAVVLHPKTDRSAFRTGTSPLYTAQPIVFQSFSPRSSANEDKPIFFHFNLIIRAVLALYVAHSSPGCILGLNVNRRIFVSQRCNIRALLIFHVQFSLLFSVVLKTWLITRWHFVFREHFSSGKKKHLTTSHPTLCAVSFRPLVCPSHHVESDTPVPRRPP